MDKSVRILTFTTILLLSIVFAVAFTGCSDDGAAQDDNTQERVAQQNTASGQSGPAPANNTPVPADTATSSGTKNVLIFGDSITAGYGIDSEEAFPALLQDRIDALGWNFNIVDGGLSGDTSAGGLRRINWMLREPIDVFILELGGNDGLRGTPPDATARNLQSIIDAVKEKYPEAKIILAGMQIPPNLGQDYTRQFREVFPTLAENNEALLIPFLLEGVGGVPALNQPDGIHPTEEGHEVVAENIWEVLQPVLQDLLNADSQS